MKDKNASLAAAIYVIFSLSGEPLTKIAPLSNLGHYSSVSNAIIIEDDECILGDSDLVLCVLLKCDEQFERKYRPAAKGVDLNTLARQVAGLFHLKSDDLLTLRRSPTRVKTRIFLF